jgi:murein DD-endopeptidase MepM/ murein hydrolase activator NlpD
MRCWPVPGSDRTKMSPIDAPGRFWEDRGDRRHCGMDIHAPAGSDVVAVEAGEVLNVAPFTSPQTLPYWNETYYVLIRHESGHFCKYAELGMTAVLPGHPVEAGQIIGQVGMVLNDRAATADAPLYIRKLKEAGLESMLHLEVYRVMPKEMPNYLGGNLLGTPMPDELVDPAQYLKTALICCGVTRNHVL